MTVLALTDTERLDQLDRLIRELRVEYREGKFRVNGWPGEWYPTLREAIDNAVLAARLPPEGK